MTDICVYTNEKVLERKKNKGFIPDHCWWGLLHIPRQLKEGDRIYFATNGHVKGYFVIEEINKKKKRIIFHSNSWMPTPQLPKYKCRKFQESKYVWWDNEAS